MISRPFALVLIFFFSIACVGAVVREAPHLGVIEEELKNLDEQALVVFDVDYTLIVPNDKILAPMGEKKFQEFIKKMRALQERGELLISKIALQSQASLVDKKILDLLEKLKQKKIKAIALTAINTGQMGAISNAEEWRVQQLRSLGIDFSWSFPCVDSLAFEEFTEKKSPPAFKRGVLASANYPKGQVLTAFLKRLQWKPSKVIFVDDRMAHIDSVECELQKANISLISFHYTSAAAHSSCLDEPLADFQLDYLMQKEEWLSDEKARQLLDARSSSERSALN